MSASLQQLLDGVGAKSSGDGWQGHCPAHDDPTPSLTITEKNGKILIHCHANCAQAEVIAALRDRGLWPIGGDGQRPAASSRRAKSAARVPIPEQAKHSLNERLRGDWSRENRGEAVRCWRYHTAEGGWVFGVVRFEKAGRKSIIPYYYGADERWHEGQPFDHDRPLYRLPELLAKPALPVVVVEGEKACDALQQLLGDAALATTWPGGSNAVSRADWSPLADRVVTIWPDRDSPGRKAAAAIAGRLPSARLIDVGSGEDGRDAADDLADGWDQERMLAFIATAMPPEEAPPDERAEVQICKGDTPQLADQVVKLLAEAGGLYQFGEGQDVLVRIADGRTEPLTVPWLLGHLERLIRFLKYDARTKGLVPTECTDRLAKLILDGRGDLWSIFPHVKGIVRARVLRLDGSILEHPGHDRDTGLLYLPMAACPDIPKEPTLDQIRAAAKKLWEPFRLFPYVDDQSRTIVLAALLTALERPVLRTAPGFGFDAPMFGTGKTLLARSIAATATGCYEPPVAWPTTEEEVGKLLLATFISAPPVRLINNVDGPVRSPSLAMVFTAEKMSGRILGLSKNIDCPTRTLILLSGNNLTLTGDLPRRVFVCRLDAGVEAPYLREFDFDPLQVTVSEWQELAAAVLTILRGYFAAGAPHTGRGTIGSFEEWDRLVRQALLWLRDFELAPFNPTDLLKAVSGGYTQDPDTLKLGALLTAWHEIFQSTPVTLRSAIETVLHNVRPEDPDCDREHEERRAALLDSISEVARDRSGLSAQALGFFIRGHLNRPWKGLRFAEASMSRGASRWRVLEDTQSTEGQSEIPSSGGMWCHVVGFFYTYKGNVSIEK